MVRLPLPASCWLALLPKSRCLRARHLLAKERGARPVPQTALLSAPSLLCLASRVGHTTRCAATSAEVTTYSVGFLHGVVQPWYGRVPVVSDAMPERASVREHHNRRVPGRTELMPLQIVSVLQSHLEPKGSPYGFFIRGDRGQGGPGQGGRGAAAPAIYLENIWERFWLCVYSAYVPRGTFCELHPYTATPLSATFGSPPG